MMTRRPNKKTAIGILACLLVSGLVPLVQSNHVNGFLSNPWGRVRSDNADLDAALDALENALGPARDAYQSLLGERLAEPQVFPVYFVDGLEPGRRVGGLDDWMSDVAGFAGWHLTAAAATEGWLGYQLVDPGSGAYPIAISNDASDVTHSYLVSPRVSLQSLPVVVEADGQEVRRTDATGTPLPVAAQQIALTMQHRFHFASTSSGGIDGGRVEIFLGGASGIDPLRGPTEADLLHGGTVLRPVSGPNTMASAFGDEKFAFTGDGHDLRSVTYDLTPYAGRDAWLVFHAASEPRTNLQDFFQSPDFFATATPFRGWAFDDIMLEGPAYPHNVVLWDVTVPGFRHPTEPAWRIVSSQDRQPIEVVAMNRGQFTETVTPTMRLEGPDGERPCQASQPQLQLRPGETAKIAFECGELTEGDTYTASALLSLPAGTIDARADNAISLTFQALRGLDLRASPPELVPRLGRSDDLRVLAVPIINRGYSTESLALDLEVFQRNLTALPGEASPGFRDVTDPLLGAVEYRLGTPQMVLTMPADPRGRENRQTAQWEFFLKQPGEYVFIAVASVDGVEQFRVTAGAGNQVADSLAYLDSFDGGVTVQQAVHPQRAEWSEIQLADVRPPANPDGSQPAYFWELPGTASVDEAPPPFVATNPETLGTPAEPVLNPSNWTSRAYLRADVDTAPDRILPTEQVKELRIRYTHYFQNMRCNESTSGECAAFDAGSVRTLATVRLLPPEDEALYLEGSTSSLTVANSEAHRRLLERPLQFIYWFGQSASSQDGPFPMSHPSNRLAYYANQWITEEYVVPLGVAGGDSIPAAALGGMSLEFLFGNAVGGLGYCPIRPAQVMCPDWRVSFMAVEAVPVQGDPVPILWMDGRPGTEIGAFRSGYTTGGTAVGAAALTASGQQQHPLNPIQSCVKEEAAGASGGAAAGASSALADQNATNAADAASDGTSAVSDQRLRCPTWARREVRDLPPPSTTKEWQRVQSLNGFLEGQGVWMHASPDSKRYNDGVATMLVSPAFVIDESMPDPVLQFRHQYRFHVPWVNGNPDPQFANHPGMQDAGTLMVRFLSETGGALVETSPFLPVILTEGVEDAASLPAQPHRFVRSDCPSPCQSFNNRVMSQEHLDLARLAVLDYRNVRYVGTNAQQRAEAGALPTAIPSNGPNVGYTNPPDPMLNPLRDPDSHALRTVATDEGSRLLDLRQDCDGPCIVQFGFRVDTAPESFRPAAATSSVAISRSKEAQHQANGASGGEGWLIGEVSILAEQRHGHDLHVAGAHLNADYDWRALSLGPGSLVNVTLSVRNEGLFRETAIEGLVAVRNADTGNLLPPVVVTAPPDLVIEPGEEREFTLPFHVPATPGRYQVMASVQINDPIAERPGLTLTDNDPGDNCAIMDSAGGFSRVCALSEAPPLRVAPNPILELELAVTPEAGLSHFPRALSLTLRNDGNVVVDDAVLRLTAQPFGAGSPQQFEWTVRHSPGPGQSSPWQHLDLRDASDDPKPALTSLVLAPGGRDSGRFLLRATITGSGVFAFSDVLADAFANAYSNTFEPGGLAVARELVSGDITPADPAWKLQDGDSFGQGRKAWQFGDPASGRAPAGADSSLVLPLIDLSGASRAALSFAHRYDLEGGFDGARAEARVVGQDWVPLEPTTGYPGTMLPTSGLNPSGDPTAPFPAFTGSSMPSSTDPEGWVLHEFNLGQIPGVTAPTLLTRFDQEGFDNVVTNFQNEERITVSSTWVLPGQRCLDHCWYRENLNRMNPEPHPALRLAASGPTPEELHSGDPDFWWSGSSGPTTGGLTTRLPLTISIPALADNEHARLSYWQWKDKAGQAQVLIKVPGVQEPFNPFASLEFSDESSGWQLQHILLKLYQGKTVTLEFEYKESPSAVPIVSNRGLVLDDVSLEFYAIGAGGIETPTRPAIPVASDSAAWATAPITPATGARWSRVDRIPDAADGWHVLPKENRLGIEGNVWWYGIPKSGGEGKYELPPSAHERLVTPLVSLKGVGGSAADLHFFERYFVDRGDVRQVLVQPMVPAAPGTPNTNENGEIAGDWVPLTVWTSPAQGSNSQECAAGGDWCERSLDVSTFIGQDIRFAFEVASNNRDTASSASPGYHWAVDEIGIVADSLAGRPVQIRFRAATDDSIDEGQWVVDNVQVVAKLYEENIAIVPSDQIDGASVPPGSSLRLAGTIRNLGSATARDLALEVTAKPVRGSVAPNIVVHTPSTGPPGSSGLFSLLPRDEVAYDVELQFPGEIPADRSSYVVTARILGQDDSGALRPLVDENLGDHERTGIVDAKAVHRVDSSQGYVSRPTLATGESVEMGIQISNTGNVPAEAIVGFSVTEVRTGDSLFESTPRLVSIAPGETHDVDTQWDEARGTGLLRSKATIDTTFGSLALPTETAVLGHLLIDRRPIFFEDSFEGDPFDRGWNSAAAARHGRECGRAQPRLTDATANPLGQWRLDAGDAFSGQQAMRLGATPVEAFEGLTYPGNRDEILRSPTVDLTQLEGLLAYPSDPLNPSLNLRYKGALGTNDGLIIQASLEGTSTGTIAGYPGRAENGNLVCHNPLVASTLVLPPTTVRPAVTKAVLERWQTATYPLAGDSVRTGGGSFALLGEDARFNVRFGSDDAGHSSGLVVDAFSISSFDLAMGPTVQQAILRNGADKVFEFRVSNTGGSWDVYTVSIDPSLGELPATVETTILTPTLSLEAGESGIARIRLRVADDVQAGFAGRNLGVLVSSTQDPGRAASGIIAIKQLQVTRLADFDVRLTRPAGETGPLDVGGATTFLATVRNRGGPSRDTTLVLIACPASGDESQALRDCRDNDPYLLTANPVRVPALPAGGQSLHTITWVPPLNFPTGQYLIAAIVDVLGTTRQLNVNNDVFSIPLEILPIQKPNLRVVSLVVSGDEGPTTQAFAGDTLRFEAIFENAGTVEAHDVQLRIVNRFPLREEQVGVLGPGQRVTVATQSIVEAGTFLVTAEASTPDPEPSTADNSAKVPLSVQRGTVLAGFDAAYVPLRRDTPTEAILTVRSLRHGDLPVRIETSVPAEIGINGIPPSLSLTRGVPARFPVAISASHLASDASGLIDVTVLSMTGHVLARAAITVDVVPEHLVIADVAPTLASPGKFSSAGRVVNAGDGLASLDLSIDAPPGWWAYAAPAQWQLQPGEGLDFSVLFEIPVATPSGVYEVDIRDHGKTVGKAAVTVTAAPAWSWEAVASDSPDVRVLRATNVGNTPGVPRLQDAGQSGLVTAIEPLPTVIAPGQSQVFRLRTGVAPSQTPLVAEQTPSSPAIQSDKWDLDPAGAPSGRRLEAGVTVRNAHAGPALGVPVRLFVDGLLADEVRIDLAPGESREVRLPWHGTGDAHVVALAVGEGETATMRAEVVRMPGPTQDAPGPASVVVLVGLALLAWTRRRRA